MSYISYIPYIYIIPVKQRKIHLSSKCHVDADVTNLTIACQNERGQWTLTKFNLPKNITFFLRRE